MSTSDSTSNTKFTKPANVRDYIGRFSGDWPTENEENGNYYIICISCGNKCLGPKRAHRCYTCHTLAKEMWDKLTPEEQKQKMIENSQYCEYLFNQHKTTK